MNGYVFLLLTIIIESIAIVLMKLANGFEHKIYFGCSIAAYLASFVLLSLALKTLPMAWTNAMWAGSSTVLVCLFGMFFFNEKINYIQAFFLFCIVVGLVGLNFFGKGK